MRVPLKQEIISMARNTHSHKHSHLKRSTKRKPSRVPKRRYDWRTKILAGAIAAALLAGGTFAHWRAKPDEDLIAKNTPNPVKNISTSSKRDLADIPPEALHPQPPMMAGGYNAYSGGLPPGALPPGVTLPGMPMMQGGRTTAQGYGVYDGIRQQFTGKERDTETGLDYFGARYYSSTQGRFTSVDPENAGADPSNPQSWNGYSYALNNPLRYTDPDGRKVRVCDKDGNCAVLTDEEAGNSIFNKRYISSIGQTVKDGRIYQGNELIGTYQRVSFDDLSDRANAVIFGNQNTAGLVDRAPAAGRAAMALWAGSVVVGATAGVGLYALGPSSSVTTLGLGTEAAGNTATVAGRVISTVGQGLKNVRQIGSGRLSGYLRGNTELPGGDQAARATFQQLTGRTPTGTFDRIVQGGKEIVYRATSGSGQSKVEIIDHAQRFLEKISFK
jgi:RHS repeat-associated protein